jgi:3-hydroxyisobutyrate dehydrogenase-like beta-hydroxyacid dehydrogenase
MRAVSGENVGVIGLGAMGLGVARSLRRSGYNVHAFDVRGDTTKAFATEGGVACGSPMEVAAACGIVVSVVVNAAQTEAVLFGPQGAAAALAPGSVFVMCSTVDPNVSIDWERRLSELGVAYLDAPMSGGAAKAAAGQMTLMTSGRPAAYARAGGVLDAMAGNVYRLGDRAGNGSKVKIINQLLAGVHIAAARLGVDALDGEVAIHATLTVAGRTVPWWPEGPVDHVDGTPAALGRALAWRAGAWPLRQALEEAFAHPDRAAELAAEDAVGG